MLVLLCGLPFAGKTTLGKQLSVAMKASYVGIDDVISDLGYSWDSASLTEPAWGAVFAEVDRRLLSHLSAGRSVIYDSTNHDRASRDRFRALADSARSHTRLVLVATTPDAVRERYERNLATRRRFTIPRPLFTQTLEAYEPPTEDEHPIVFQQSDDPGDWITRHIDEFAPRPEG